VFLLLWVILTGKSLKLGISKKKLGLLFVTGIALGANWILLFEAYNYTTVAVATLCYYMQPTLLILLSPLVFREKLTTKKGLCAAVSLMGMALVSGVLGGDALGSGDIRGILFGLAAAAMYTTVIILNKKNPVENAYGKTVVQLFSSAVVLLPYLLLTETPGSASMNATAIVMLLVVCIVHTGMAYAMYFAGVQQLPSQTVAVLSYIDPVLAMVLAAVILKEPMSASELIGGVMILGAAAVSEGVFQKHTKKPIG
jgi:RarD protein